MQAFFSFIFYLINDTAVLELMGAVVKCLVYRMFE